MNRILRDIVEAKKQDLQSILTADSPEVIGLQRYAFAKALKDAPAPSLICEIKKASPSQGVISADFDVAEIAESYREGGASCLSVLTDVRFFQGAAENVALAKKASGLPVLCKDFFIDPRQMKWAWDLGADAVLLIMRILSDGQAQELNAAAVELGLDVLVETHDEEDIERAQEFGASLIGVNCRDLDTFHVSLEIAERLYEYIPDDAHAVAESGINTFENVDRLQKCGYESFLVGSSLMRASDRAQAVRELRGEKV